MKTIWGSFWGDAGSDFGPPDASPIDYSQFPRFQDVELGAGSGATASGSGAPAIGGAGATQTVTHAGSGLVFVNTFGAGALASPAFQNAVVAAETYLESHFTNSITINASFDLQALNKAFSGQNSFNLVTTNYQSLVNAFQAHATSPDDTAAVTRGAPEATRRRSGSVYCRGVRPPPPCPRRPGMYAPNQLAGPERHCDHRRTRRPAAAGRHPCLCLAGPFEGVSLEAVSQDEAF